MKKFLEAAKANGFNPKALTLGETIDLAEELGVSVGDVALEEARYRSGLSMDEALDAVEGAFQHNLRALEIGLTNGGSFLFDRCAAELAENDFARKLFDDQFINKAGRSDRKSHCGLGTLRRYRGRLPLYRTVQDHDRNRGEGKGIAGCGGNA